MPKINRLPGMCGNAYRGKFHIVNDKTGLSLQSEYTVERAEGCLADLANHENLCEQRRAADPKIERREKETYHIEIED